jgi:capsular exopolysaccharide synthesis family protein
MPKLSRRDAAHAAEVVAIKPDGSFGEAMRTLRTSLLLGSIDEPYSIIAVTSSVPGEGKSTVSFNLALSMSQTSKTLFIECDLRRPSLPGNRRSPNGLGLSDVIADRVEVSKCIFTPTGSTLDVLAAGAVPPDPLELLSSRRFATLLRTLAQQYESIVLDTPPVAVVSDAVVIASHATGIVFVVKADATPYRVALRSLVRLRSAETPVVGVVLNQMDFRKAEKYHGEYSATGTDDYSAPYGGGRHAEPR